MNVSKIKLNWPKHDFLSALMSVTRDDFNESGPHTVKEVFKSYKNVSESIRTSSIEPYSTYPFLKSP